MDIFSYFRKKRILLRCTECNYDYEYTEKEVRLLEEINAHDPVCPVKEECHMCHSGYMIPFRYTGKDGKVYLFHEIKPKVEKLDPNKLMDRIFENPDNVGYRFF